MPEERMPQPGAWREGDLMTVAEAVRVSRLSRSAIYQMMQRRRLEYVQVGRSRRILRASLDKLLRAAVVPARPGEE